MEFGGVKISIIDYSNKNMIGKEMAITSSSSSSSSSPPSRAIQIDADRFSKFPKVIIAWTYQFQYIYI